MLTSAAPGGFHNHYGGKPTFPRITDELMAAADQADSAQRLRSDILEPKG